MKFIDDLTLAESIYLKENLIKNLEPRQTFSFHERTGHILPEENHHVQRVLDELIGYTEDHQMRKIDDKTKVILFHNAVQCDLHRILTLDGSTQLEVQGVH